MLIADLTVARNYLRRSIGGKRKIKIKSDICHSILLAFQLRLH